MPHRRKKLMTTNSKVQYPTYQMSFKFSWPPIIVLSKFIENSASGTSSFYSSSQEDISFCHFFHLKITFGPVVKKPRYGATDKNG